MKHWFGSSTKPETNDEPRTVSKRPSSILRKGNNSSDSSDIFDPMCNDCSEGQGVSMAMSDNSSDDSSSCMNCGHELTKYNSRQFRERTKRVSFNKKVSKRIYLTNVNENTRKMESRNVTVNRPLHVHSSFQIQQGTTRYVIHVPTHSTSNSSAYIIIR